MGCKSSPAQKEGLIDRIKDSINRDDTSSIPHILNLLKFEEKLDLSFLVNKPIIEVEKFKVNLLTYSLWMGSANCFEYLISKLNASVQIMEELLSVQKLSPMSIICEKAYIDILKIYLPYYIKTFNSSKKRQDKSVTISFSNNPHFQEHSENLTPIQLACIKGNLHIIKYLNEFFEVQCPPHPLDVHSIDEITGENCALLSVRTGNFVLIKFLHETIKADFSIKNNKEEGALQILAAATRFESALNHLECVMYLVEIIKVDILYMHEETLLLLENKLIVKYIEEQLKKLGVMASKRELESLYRIKSYKPIEETVEKSSVIGDTQEISGITPNSNVSNFGFSFKFN